jgi:hypothetical protein
LNAVLTWENSDPLVRGSITAGLLEGIWEVSSHLDGVESAAIRRAATMTGVELLRMIYLLEP